MSRTEFMRQLTEAGLRDFIVIDREVARTVLTERRLELLEAVGSEGVTSVTALSETVGRDVAAVSRDLDLLFERDLVDFERQGSRKAPVLKHGSILVEPLP